MSWGSWWLGVACGWVAGNAVIAAVIWAIAGYRRRAWYRKPEDEQHRDLIGMFNGIVANPDCRIRGE